MPNCHMCKWHPLIPQLPKDYVSSYTMTKQPTYFNSCLCQNTFLKEKRQKAVLQWTRILFPLWSIKVVVDERIHTSGQNCYHATEKLSADMQTHSTTLNVRVLNVTSDCTEYYLLKIVCRINHVNSRLQRWNSDYSL